MDSPYSEISAENYPRSGRGLSNSLLREYFDRCFDAVIERFGTYQAWACITCAADRRPSVIFDPDSASECPSCGSSRVFQVATFQSRAARVGKVFEAAVVHLFRLEFQLALTATPQNTTTHDLEASRSIAIEVKGSPRRIVNPQYGPIRLPRPGLLRSDTQKKAIANARNFKQANPSGSFYVLTNALPSALVGVRAEDVNGYFDVTKADRVRAFVDEVRALL